ncbi:MAG: NADH-quinone oxidoreductase subunit NuoE [Magnetospiraceae bacterium]
MSVSISTVEQPETFGFNNDNKAKVKEIIAKYPEGRQSSAVMPLLDLAQRQHQGWLPKAAMDHIADMLGMPAIKVYEVASFYTMYNLAPVGEYHVQVCTNISCFIRGSDEIAAACKKALGVEFGETTKDGKFTLAEVECLGACVNAPMIQVNDDFYEDLTAESVTRVLEAMKKGETPTAGPQGARKGCMPANGLTTLMDQADLAAKVQGGKG